MATSQSHEAASSASAPDGDDSASMDATPQLPPPVAPATGRSSVHGVTPSVQEPNVANRSNLSQSSSFGSSPSTPASQQVLAMHRSSSTATTSIDDENSSSNGSTSILDEKRRLADRSPRSFTNTPALQQGAMHSSSSSAGSTVLDEKRRLAQPAAAAALARRNMQQQMEYNHASDAFLSASSTSETVAPSLNTSTTSSSGNSGILDEKRRLAERNKLQSSVPHVTSGAYVIPPVKTSTATTTGWSGQRQQNHLQQVQEQEQETSFTMDEEAAAIDEGPAEIYTTTTNTHPGAFRVQAVDYTEPVASHSSNLNDETALMHAQLIDEEEERNKIVGQADEYDPDAARIPVFKRRPFQISVAILLLIAIVGGTVGGIAIANSKAIEDRTAIVIMATPAPTPAPTARATAVDFPIIREALEKVIPPEFIAYSPEAFESALYWIAENPYVRAPIPEPIPPPPPPPPPPAEPVPEPQSPLFYCNGADGEPCRGRGDCTDIDGKPCGEGFWNGFWVIFNAGTNSTESATNGTASTETNSTVQVETNGTVLTNDTVAMEAKEIPEDPLFVQRFVLAWFYFHTSKNGNKPWKSCNPPNYELGEDDVCLFSNLTGFLDVDGYLFQYEYANATRWLSNTHECDWVGVRCYYGMELGFLPGTVALMELEGMEISGQLPIFLQLLPALQVMILSNNNLTGTIPDGMDRFSLLQIVDLNNNQLSGQIPDSIFSMPQLLHLDLARNELTGTIPPSVGNATYVSALLLSRNQFEGPLPDEIGNLAYLQYLQLHECGLAGVTIPLSCGRLQNLKMFWMYSNGLVGEIPEEWSNLKRLTDLRLQENMLHGQLPQFLPPSLKILELSQNQFNGTIPDFIYSMPNLEALSLSNNKISGRLKSEIGLMRSLKNLTLYDNQMTGPIPVEIANITNLQILTIHYNQFTGEVPLDICLLSEARLSADCDRPSGGGDDDFNDCYCCTSCCDRVARDCRTTT